MRSRLGVLFAMAAAGLLSAAFTRASDSVVSSRLPEPKLILTGLRYYESGGREWTRYLFRVENLADFADELFAAAPELPPCGLNTRAARTWVDVYAANGRRLYGFCALPNHDALGELWFNIATDSVPPDSVYIELTDRASGSKSKSNRAPTSKGPRCS